MDFFKIFEVSAMKLFFFFGLLERFPEILLKLERARTIADFSQKTQLVGS